MSPTATPSSDRTSGWRHFPHGADIGVCGYGPSAAAAFEQAGYALEAVVTTEPVRAAICVEISCVAPDLDLLLVDWLNALIFEMASRRMLFGRFVVALKGNALHAEAWGEPLDQARHRPVVEVKGATYTELKVDADVDGVWRAQCVVDV